MSSCPANFVLLVEMGFHYVGQDDLEFLTSGDPPSLASLNAGNTGVSHRAEPVSILNVSVSCSLEAEHLVLDSLYSN